MCLGVGAVKAAFSYPDGDDDGDSDYTHCGYYAAGSRSSTPNSHDGPSSRRYASASSSDSGDAERFYRHQPKKNNASSRRVFLCSRRYNAQQIPINMDFLRDVSNYFGIGDPSDDEASVYAPIHTRGIIDVETHNNKSTAAAAVLFDERDGSVGVLSFKEMLNEKPHRHKTRKKAAVRRRRHNKKSQRYLNRKKTRRKVSATASLLEFNLKLHNHHYVIQVQRVKLLTPEFDVDFIGARKTTRTYKVDAAQYYNCHYRGKIYELFDIDEGETALNKPNHRRRRRNQKRQVGVAAVSHCPVVGGNGGGKKSRQKSRLRHLGTVSADEQQQKSLSSLHALLKFDASSDRYVIEPLPVYVHHRREKNFQQQQQQHAAQQQQQQFDVEDAVDDAAQFTSHVAHNAAHSAAARDTKRVAHQVGESAAVKTSERFLSQTYGSAKHLAHQAAETEAGQATGRFGASAWHETQRDANIVGTFTAKEASKAKHYVLDNVDDNNNHNLQHLSVIHRLFHSEDGIDMPSVPFVFDTPPRSEDKEVEFQRAGVVASAKISNSNPVGGGLTPNEQQESDQVEQFAPKNPPTTTPSAMSDFDTPLPPAPFWLELAAFIDYEMYARIDQLYKSKQEKVNLVLATFNAVQLLYGDGTLREIQPHLLMRTLKWVASAERNFPTHGNVVDYMTEFCQNYQPRFVHDFSNDKQVWDLAVVLTGLDVWGAAADVTKDPAYRGLKSTDQKLFAVTGVAFTGGVCAQGKNCAVIEYMKLMSASDTIAHEIGHSLSMKHDGSDNDCDRYAGRIMGRSEHGKERFGWSRCSYATLRAFLDGDKSQCLKVPPAQQN